MCRMIPPQLSCILFQPGQKFMGLDTFGWGVVLFLVLFFGAFYTREYLRRKRIPDWPVTSARVEKTTFAPGPPAEIRSAPAGVPYDVVFPYHCRANYVFVVDGTRYGGTFSLLANDEVESQKLIESLRDQSILVKYNPLRPKESIVKDRELLGKKVFQEGWNPIDPKIW
jgi:hypothetical protein